jgi:hypothetical protein
MKKIGCLELSVKNNRLTRIIFNKKLLKKKDLKKIMSSMVIKKYIFNKLLIRIPLDLFKI